MNIFVIGEALASDTIQSSGGSLISNLMPIVLIITVFYFLLLRPQQKKMKAHQAMIKDLKKGDNVVISGGIFGTVVKTSDENVLWIEIAHDIKIKVRRDAVAEIVKNDEYKALASTSSETDKTDKSQKTPKNSKTK